MLLQHGVCGEARSQCVYSFSCIRISECNQSTFRRIYLPFKRSRPLEGVCSCLATIG